MFDVKKLLDALTAATSQASDSVRDGAGDMSGLARSIFGHATDGVSGAARDFDAKTGAGSQIDDLIRQVSGGRGAGDLLNSAKSWAGDNKAAAGAIVGGLGALLLGTRSGRSLSLNAAKLGGLVLIDGLAYDAYKRYTAGAGSGEDAANSAEIAPPPDGSGFETAAISDELALNYVEAMIAAAVADGHLDANERRHIISGLQQAGVDQEAAEFLEDTLANPPSPEQLAIGVSTDREAAQVYTAARLAIEPDTQAEQNFLAELADALGIEGDLANSVNERVLAVRA